MCLWDDHTPTTTTHKNINYLLPLKYCLKILPFSFNKGQTKISTQIHLVGINFPIVTLPTDVSKNTPQPPPTSKLYTELDLFLCYSLLNFGNTKLVIIMYTSVGVS